MRPPHRPGAPASEPPPRRLRREERIWALAWIAVNALVIVGVAILVPVFRRMARAMDLSQAQRVLFYVIAAVAVGNAIRRIVLQWMRLARRDRHETY